MDNEQRLDVKTNDKWHESQQEKRIQVAYLEMQPRN